MLTNEAAQKEIAARLKRYRETQRQIAILEYRQFYEPGLSQEKIIEDMALSSSLNAVKGGGISDRTMHIALGYQGRTARLNREHQRGIAEELERLKREVRDLEFYVGLLDARRSEIIRAHYFQGVPWPELAERYQVSIRTLTRWCSAAIEQLAGFYQLAAGEKGEK